LISSVGVATVSLRGLGSQPLHGLGRGLARFSHEEPAELPRPDVHRLGETLHRKILMQVLARACGHHELSKLCIDDLTTFDRDMAALTKFAGPDPLIDGPMT
jgi:hypothetical protein